MDDSIKSEVVVIDPELVVGGLTGDVEVSEGKGRGDST